MAEGDKIVLQTPYALAMMICDSVYIDPVTGKKSLLGIFHSYHAFEFPLTMAQAAVYIAVTDGRGRCAIRVRLVDAEEQRPAIFEKDGELNFDDPRGVYELVMRLENVVFPSAGEYLFQFYSHGDFVMERRIICVDLTEEES